MPEPSETEAPSGSPPTLAEQARTKPVEQNLRRELWAIFVLYCALAVLPLLFGLICCE